LNLKFAITHITRYQYNGAVTENVNEVRLTPRSNYRQSCYHHSLTVEPATNLLQYEDFFGNRICSFSVVPPHQELLIKAQSIVVTQNQEPQSASLLPFKKELELLKNNKFQNRYAEYLLPTSSVKLSKEVESYAKSIGSELKFGSIYETVYSIMNAIYRDFAYSPGTTNVCTTVNETLELRQGVCQDFTHLMLAICRVQGIPARYVSGYHFVQDLQCVTAEFEQASHAWVEAHIPGVGWLGFDPTNNTIMSWRYVKLGHGRDYLDIVPIKGIYKGIGNPIMEVNVDVRQVENEIDT
jgi:transglutaminase-like putative cysteine protease